MIYRYLSEKIREVINHYPIIGLTGPRQSGKTTLLKNIFSEFKYVNFEDLDTREFAKTDPRSFLEQFGEKVIFDEVQNVPELFSYLQTKVDAEGKMGNFILSGSQNFNLMEKITQTLAGRVALFRLFPFDSTEMKKADWLKVDLPITMSKGFYPAIFHRKLDHDIYYANYIETYVQRDVSQLVNIQNKNAFKNFLKLCAYRAGQLLNYNDLARDAGISHSTARNWLSILETSYVLFLLPPYFENFGKRLIKSPKLYFYDTGLLCHLLGVRKSNIGPTFSHWGHIFENMIISDLLKQNEHSVGLKEYYFWRDSNGHEIDLLYREGDSFSIYEIKASGTVQSKMFEGLNYFYDISGNKVKEKILIYGGKQIQKRNEILILPWSEAQ
jgi:predicted AAA+ superfamily ATPase